MVQVNVLFPDEDFDEDGFSNALEIDNNSNPFDDADTPSQQPGFVEPVSELLCDVDVQLVSLSWSLPEPNPYDR